jgi:hypothetical protein
MTTKKPSLIAFNVVRKEPSQPIRDARKYEIGVAWMHADANGFSLTLHSLPLDGKVWLRHPEPDWTNPAEQRNVASSRVADAVAALMDIEPSDLPGADPVTIKQLRTACFHWLRQTETPA